MLHFFEFTFVIQHISNFPESNSFSNIMQYKNII